MTVKLTMPNEESMLHVLESARHAKNSVLVMAMNDYVGKMSQMPQLEYSVEMLAPSVNEEKNGKM